MNMGDCSLDDFNHVLGSGGSIESPRSGSRPTTLQRRMFENPFYSEYTLSRIARSRQNVLHVESSWTPATSSCESTLPSSFPPPKGDGATSRLLASYLIGEMASAVASTLGFIAVTDKRDVPIWLTGTIFTISVIVVTWYINEGRKTYPANILAYLFFLCTTLVMLIHANISGVVEFHIYNLELASLCCFAGAVAFLVLSFLPFYRIRRTQLLYSLPPIILTLSFAYFVSVKLYKETPWSSFGIVSIAALIIVPSSFITTIMIKHYILCIP